MSATYESLKTNTTVAAGTAGAFLGKGLLPAYAAPATRCAVGYCWGPVGSFGFNTVSKRVAVEAAGHFAYSNSIALGGLAGGLVGTLAITLLFMGIEKAARSYAGNGKTMPADVKADDQQAPTPTI